MNKLSITANANFLEKIGSIEENILFSNIDISHFFSCELVEEIKGTGYKNGYLLLNLNEISPEYLLNQEKYYDGDRLAIEAVVNLRHLEDYVVKPKVFHESYVAYYLMLVQRIIKVASQVIEKEHELIFILSISLNEFDGAEYPYSYFFRFYTKKKNEDDYFEDLDSYDSCILQIKYLEVE